MKKIVGALGLFLSAHLMNGQGYLQLTSLAEEVNYDRDGKPHYLRFKPSERIGEAGVTAFLNEVLGSDNQVRLLKSENDELGFQHVRYEVLQRGITAANKIIIAHIYQGKLVSINGDIVAGAMPANSFALSEKEALAAALKKIGAKKYKWENKEEEAHMRQALNEPNFTYQPTGEKVILERDGKTSYAYKFNIYAEEPLYRANVFVDASTGRVLDEQNLICTADVPGMAVTKYSGTQQFTCDQAGAIYRLRESGRGLGVETYNMQNGSSYGGSVDFTNSSSAWTSTGFNQAATDAHWGAEMTYDYYLNEHNRNSVDNNGKKLLSYIHYQNNFTNAFWDGQRMTYGDGNGSSMNIFTTLDICGHEISHGLTSNSAGLIYQNESGALNESYSDIFGASIENYARPTNWNWKIGEDMTFGGTGLRNMANPGSFGDPDTYGAGTYYFGTNDNGGVHTNSGVSNYWYYLLTIGGSGTNDVNNAFSVTGIGFTKASKIAFRALTVYYTPSTNYATARNLSVQAAKDLYGICSPEVVSTTNAWYAVGVGAQYVQGFTGANFISNSTNFCALPASVNFTNTTVSGLSYFWDFGDGTSSTSTNTAHTYTATGAYTIKLKAVGCNGLDSVIKGSHITISLPTPPSVSDVTICNNNAATLTASGNASLIWYDGPFTNTAVSVGPTFVTPSLTGNYTYYVANTASTTTASGGIASNTGGGFLNNTAHYLIFNVNQSSVLNSVVVYAIGAGNRIFQLRNSSGTLLSTMSVSLSAGANTVNLGFNLAPGNGYRLGLSTTSGTGLYRSNTGVSYPYNIGSMVDIVTSSLGNNNYFWFYNWNVSRAACASSKIPVNVSINPLPMVYASATTTMVCMDDEVPLTGTPTGGVFANNGTTGSTFNATSLGAGTHTVLYTYTDDNGCSNTAAIYMLADACSGIDKNDITGISVFPNPTSESLVIRNGEANSRVMLLDASGRLVLQQTVTQGEAKIDISALADGMYVLTIYDQAGRSLKTTKLVKE